MGKTEILKQWLEKGKDDLRAAEYLSTMHHPTPLSSNVFVLNRYSVLPRYPNELDISNEDMRNALVNAKTIQEFVMKIFDGAVRVAS